MSTNANIQIDKRLINTSVRKHLCQKLFEHEISDSKAVHFTGHKNVESLNRYRVINNKQQHAMSTLLSDTAVAIAKPCCSTTTHTPTLPPTTQAAKCVPHVPADVSVSNVPAAGSSGVNTAVANLHKSSKSSAESVFANSVIHGGVFNITINNNMYQNRKRKFVIESDSEDDI